MIDFNRLNIFEEYVDEKTGVRSYILNKKPAECVQSLYFTNQSLSDDQKYLWMYCFYPPLRHHSLGVVSLDPEKPFVRVFKEAVFHGVTPLVAPEGDKVYFVDGYVNAAQICTIDVNGNIELFARMDPGYIGKKELSRFGTHLSISANGRYMLVDGMFSTFGFAALVDMETREFKVINEYEGMYNHGQFSPVHPKLFLLDQDSSSNPITGKCIAFKNRTWLCDTDATLFAPVVPRSWHGHDGTMFCHDFWSQDGWICWQDYQKGAYEMNPDTNEMVHVWKEPLCHVHTNADRSLWVADQSPYGWPKKSCRVIFFNRSTGKTVDIYSALPAPRYKGSETAHGAYSGREYHLDPHPQFSRDGNYIVCTTTARGGVDISITPVAQLVALTQ